MTISSFARLQVHRTTEAAIKKKVRAFSQICMKAARLGRRLLRPDAPNTASELKDKECPNCGTLNAHSALFCNICGTSLTARRMNTATRATTRSKIE